MDKAIEVRRPNPRIAQRVYRVEALLIGVDQQNIGSHDLEAKAIRFDAVL